VGLYIPVIEKEYRNEAKENEFVAGLYGFIAQTAKDYGVEPANRTDVSQMAPAAAKYLADRMSEFGADATSMTLVLAGYNRSPNSVRRDMVKLRRENPNLERSFWSLMANKDKLDHWFQNENSNYVPRFYAAAIIGENPKIFGLTTQPLSTYTEPAK
jgi:membrane-bound lytic murein transglycosylase MltF